jgi:hypothetical protein
LLFVLPTPPVMILSALVFWLSLSFGSPFHLRLWGAMYPGRLVGRVVGFLGMGRAAAAALAALAGGIIADQLGGPTAVALAGAVGVACAVAYAGLRSGSEQRPLVYSARESIHALSDRPVLGQVALAQGFYGGGLIAAIPLFALVHVDRLDLSLADVGVIGILSALGTTVLFPVWGAVSDRFGPLVTLRVGSTLGVLCLIGYAIAPNVVLLWAMAFAFGAASASVDVGIVAIVTAQTPLAQRAPAMAGWNAITGVRGIAAAFLMSAMLQLGVVDVTSGLLLCALSSAVGVLMFVRVDPNAPERVPAPGWRGAPDSPMVNDGKVRRVAI